MPYITIKQNVKQDQSTIYYIKPLQLKQTPSYMLLRQLPRNKIPYLLIQLYKQFSSNLHPLLKQGLLPFTIQLEPIVLHNPPVYITQLQLLANIIKIYTSNDKKYKGKEYNIQILNFKYFLTIAQKSNQQITNSTQHFLLCLKDKLAHSIIIRYLDNYTILLL